MDDLGSQRSHTPLVHIPKKKAKKKGIRAVSPKRAMLNRLYQKVAKEFLGKHPYCQHFMAEHGIDEDVAIANCGLVLMKVGDGFTYVRVPQATEIHHKRGRGEFLCDPTYFMACRPGHSVYIHGNPGEAYRKGYMLPR